MAFDTKQFLKEKFSHRTQDVPVPDLKKWFPEDEKPVWTVRGLDGKELGRCKESASKNKSIAGIVAMLKGAKVTEQTQALESLLNLGGSNTPDNIAERLDQLCMASLSPACTLDLALKLCRVHPITFLALTNAVLKLTGKGMEPGEQKDSGV